MWYSKATTNTEWDKAAVWPSAGSHVLLGSAHWPVPKCRYVKIFELTYWPVSLYKKRTWCAFDPPSPYNFTWSADTNAEAHSKEATPTTSSLSHPHLLTINRFTFTLTPTLTVAYSSHNDTHNSYKFSYFNSKIHLHANISNQSMHYHPHSMYQLKSTLCLIHYLQYRTGCS